MRNTDHDKKIVGIGELLWDRFPDYKRPGGAPANVAFHASVLGNHGVILSRIGSDSNGSELKTFLIKHNVDVSYLQSDLRHPTGTVDVHFEDGEPEYTITDQVAWDYLEMTQKWNDLARETGAVCFGTLAQRNSTSRNTIRSFIRHTRPTSYRIFDMNLRPPFYDNEILFDSIKLANVIKLNRDESELLQEVTGEPDPIQWLLREQAVDIVCVTLGSEGSKLFTLDGTVTRKGESVDTERGDAVGVGDAFTAALADALLKNLSMEEVLNHANNYAAKIATMKGGMPSELLNAL